MDEFPSFVKIKWVECTRGGVPMNRYTPRLVVAAVVALVVVTSAVAPAAAATQSSDSPVVAQVQNGTATATEAAGECDPDDPPKMDTARLFTREDTITTGQPGVVAGGFLPPAALQCDMVVRVTMQVPNNMYIQGTNKLSSGGAGIVSSEFTIPAGASSVESVRANVYASETGTLTVTADIVYWPEGSPDHQRTISGLTLEFDVNEPVEQPTGTPASGGDSGGSDDGSDGGDASTGGSGSELPLTPLQLAIVGLTLVGIASAITVRRVFING